MSFQIDIRRILEETLAFFVSQMFEYYTCFYEITWHVISLIWKDLTLYGLDRLIKQHSHVFMVKIDFSIFKQSYHIYVRSTIFF
jgi:hypothetical protein